MLVTLYDASCLVYAEDYMTHLYRNEIVTWSFYTTVSNAEIISGVDTLCKEIGNKIFWSALSETRSDIHVVVVLRLLCIDGLDGISPVELGLNIAQNGTEINNMSLEAEFHPY